MSVPIPSTITAEALDLENLFSLIQILGNDASVRDVHGESLAVVGVQCYGGEIQANDGGPQETARRKHAAPT